MKAILTSSLGGQVKMEGKRLPSKLLEANGLLKSILIGTERVQMIMFRK